MLTRAMTRSQSIAPTASYFGWRRQSHLLPVILSLLHWQTFNHHFFICFIFRFRSERLTQRHSSTRAEGRFSFFPAHLVTLERGSHQHHRPHGGDHVIRGDVLRLLTQRYLISGGRLIAIKRTQKDSNTEKQIKAESCVVWEADIHVFPHWDM